MPLAPLVNLRLPRGVAHCATAATARPITTAAAATAIAATTNLQAHRGRQGASPGLRRPARGRRRGSEGGRLVRRRPAAGGVCRRGAGAAPPRACAPPRAPNRRSGGRARRRRPYAGLSAEFAKILILHPIDTVRTRLQSRRLLESRLNAFSRRPGAVSVAEMEAALRAARPDILAAVRALVEEADEDGSGEIEKESSLGLKRQLRGDGDGAFSTRWPRSFRASRRARARGEQPARPVRRRRARAADAAPQAGVYAATREVARRELGALVAASQIQSDAAALLAVVAELGVYWGCARPPRCTSCRSRRAP